MVDWKSVQQLMEEQKFDTVLEKLSSVPEEQRDTVEFLSTMGILHTYFGNWIEAAKFLLGALGKMPDDPDNLYNLCFVSMKMKDVSSFRACFDRLNRMDLSSETYQQLEIWKKQLYGKRTSKNLLMIAYYYPPLSGSGVFRSLKYSKYLREYGWEPTVIAASSPPNGWNFRDNSLIQEIPDGMNVIRIDDPFSTGTLKQVDFRPIMKYQKAVLQHDPQLLKMYDDMLKKGEKGIIQLLQFPHHDLYWTYLVAEYISKNIDMTRFDAVYTTSGPYSSDLLGCYLQEKYNIPWVADYRDEWTGNPYAKMDEQSEQYQMFLQLEKLLLHHADKNITMAESLCDVYQQRFGLAPDKVVSITNGYDEMDFRSLKQSCSVNPCFTVVYSGLLYMQERSVEPILDAIKVLIEKKLIPKEKIKLELVGTRPEDTKNVVNKYGLHDQVQATGYIAHLDALQYSLNGDLLILLMGDKEKYQHYYSGKIFDYIRCRKQILALAPPHGVIAELFKKMGYGLITQSTNQEQIQRYIYEEYMKWESSAEPTAYKYEGEWRFERSYLTGCLADVLDSLEYHSNETKSEIYDGIYRTGGAGQAYHKHYTQSFYFPCWQRAMRYLYLLDRGINILEVGCGAGQFANMLFDAGFYNYQGIDYSKEAIKLAQKNNPDHLNSFFIADAFRDPILEEPHDLVIMFEVLEHIQDDLRLLSRLPEGTNILISVPNFMDPTHVRCFKNKEEITARFGKILEIRDIQDVPADKYGRILFYILANVKGNHTRITKPIDTMTTLSPYTQSVLEVDKNFQNLVQIVNTATSSQLEEMMVQNFKKQSTDFRNFVSKVTHGYPIRGMIDAESGRGTMVSERVQCLKEHIGDFEWLYNRLADYRSRGVLYGILAHWITYEPVLIKKIQENLFADYFDLDIMPLTDQEVIVDLGMYVGDTTIAYHKVCKHHKKWYGYEVDGRNIPKAKENVKGIPNVEIRQKAVSDRDGYIFMSAHQDSSSNVVGKGDIRVPTVTLDTDIQEEVTLIKMDIEGSEQSALRGSVRHILNEKPKLAICTYHGNYDIWQIPRLIDSIRGDYKFYMRYNGTDLAIPREYVLIAI